MAQTPLVLTGRSLTHEGVVAIARGRRVAIAPRALRRAQRSKASLERLQERQAIYGVNTGFGPMASHIIPVQDLQALQLNLVRSHAAGAGEAVPKEWVRAAMVVRLNTLLLGYSGVSSALLMRLRDLLNKDVVPVVPEHGGVGASGDLIQLAHIALGLIGEGEVFYKGRRMSAQRALRAARIAPYVLEAKEGLALINGTSYMTGVACLVLSDARATLSTALRAGALALEAVHGFSDALSPALHAARPHEGQVRVAALLRALTKGSKLMRSRAAFMRAHGPKSAVQALDHAAQDVYSLRCLPQIAGPVLESLWAAERTVGVELNAATDNPLVTARGEFLHGGNFHGDAIAVAMDTLKIGLIKLSLLSERRLNFLLNSAVNRRFLPFLNLGVPGLTLGLQGLQFTATSTAARNQSLGYQHSLHTIPSNADNQDVVSMGADAAHTALAVAQNSRIIVAIECIALGQALAQSKEAKLLGAESRRFLRDIQKICPPVRADRPLWNAISKTAAWIAASSANRLKF